MDKKQVKRRYFAAANTQDGFVSFFEEIFFSRDIKKRYIIKGGPGTGKSSFMKKVALRAEEQGRRTEYYYCSSDTSSLDGIVIDGVTAIFDGTAPHSYDTVLPGACDEIINLGEYWNSELLASHWREIAELGAKKSRAYKIAYGYLSAAGSAQRTADSIIFDCVDFKKLCSAARRKVEQSKRTVREGERHMRQTDAFGVCGKVHLDTLEALSGSKIYIEDYYGTAYLFLGELERQARASGYDTYVSVDTTDISKIREVYLPDVGQYYGVSDEPCDVDRTVNMKRFVNADKLSEVRFAYRTAIRCAQKLEELAADSLARAGAYHASMEKYYILAMDFDGVEKKRIEVFGK